MVRNAGGGGDEAFSATFRFVRHDYETSGKVQDPAILPPLQLARGTLYVLVPLPLVRSLTAGRGGTGFVQDRPKLERRTLRDH